MNEKKNKEIGIISTGKYLPEKIMTNFDLEKMLDTSNEWIVKKTGINTRRIAADNQATSDLAVAAAKEALSKGNIGLDEIDLLIVATSSPDTIQPSTAALVQHKLGLANCAVFDISAVCSGYVYALSMAVDIMKGNDRYKKALVIGAETYSRLLDWTDRTTCVFFGDGAGAVVLGAIDVLGQVRSSYLMANGEGYELIYFPAGGSRLPASRETLEANLHVFKMNGKKVWDFVMFALPDAIENVLKGTGFSKKDISLVIPHQANLRLIEAAMQKTGISMDNVFINLDKYGNTSGASIGIALDEAMDQGRIVKGDLVVLVGFGGGLTWGACLIKF